MEFCELRSRYKEFSYESYEISMQGDKLILEFSYKLKAINEEDINFKHKVTYELFGNDKKLFSENIEKYKNMIFHIGLIETINYWKLACPSILSIKCGKINENQKEWFKKLYYNGLGEFIYLNHIVDDVNQENFVNIISETGNDSKKVNFDTSGNLIAVGGGKDSVVTLELLKEDFDENIPFVMSPPIAAYDCIDVAGYDRYLLATRVFDKKILDMNNKGYLNGHVPFSAILGFIAVLGAAFTGKKYIPLSNERSANEPSVIGTTFNHQYSKSYEFEEDFIEYVNGFLTDDIHYFSLLRPMYEIKIAELFSKFKKYHSVYRSCNRGKKENEWCGNCPKCLFVYIILSPYIERKELIQQFGKDLLEDMNLKDIFEELIGIRETKPFECVGTIWEVKHALNETLKIYDDAKLLQHYKTLGLHKIDVKPDVYEEGDHLPDKYKKIVNKAMRH